MEKLNLSLVSYANTLPFRYGVETSDELLSIAKITFANPANCAKNILNGNADIGLVPVGALPDIGNYNIVSNFCIGANKKVDSVVLYGNTPVSEMKQIVLDYQSRTSRELVKILCKKHWNITPEFINGDKGFENKGIKEKQGILIIGDRTFELKNKYSYTYDLSKAWYEYSGLPFVFAIWISKKNITDPFLKIFHKALQYGIDHIKEASEKYNNLVPQNFDLVKYLTKSIDYNFDLKKHKAMQIFLNLIQP